MTFLPIIDRELRVRARSRATYWTRFAVGLAGIIICLQSMGATPLGLQSSLGRFVFNIIVTLAFLLSCGACLLTADTISVERREGTLGLLFLTRVRAFDVLAGKLGSVGLTSLCALGAFLPILMVPVLAGGITGGEAFRKGLALMDGLFFALAAGLCASAAQKERFKASRSAALIVALVAVVPLLPFAVATRSIHRYLGLISPVALLVSAGDSAYKASPLAFWLSFGSIQFLSWCLMLGAALRLRRSVGEDGGAFRLHGPAEPEETRRVVGLTRWEPAREDTNPVEWLVYRERGISAWLWGLAVLALAMSAWGFVGHFSAPARGTGGFWLLALPLETAVAAFGAAVVAWVASRFFFSVRRNGELELLMTTPVGAESIACAQGEVLKRFFAWPTVGVQAALLLALLPALHGRDSGWAMFVLCSVVFAFANTWFGIAALCWVGMWFGLTGRTQAGAVLWTVCVAKGVPLLVSLLSTVLTMLIADWFGGARAGSLLFFAWGSELVMLVYFLALVQVAKKRVS